MSSFTPPPPASAPAAFDAEPEQPGLSEPARIINTFVAPSKTFLDIRQNASWWVPWLLISVFSIAFSIVVDKKVGYDHIARNAMANNSQFEQQTPEQQSRTLSIVTASYKYGSYASPILTLLFALIVTLVLWATFNFGMAAEIPFGRAMAIVLYGWLPGLVGAVLTMISVWFGDPEGFRLEYPVGTNPAYYMSPGTSKFLLGALSSLDVISLWMVALIGIGFALNAKKKLSTGTAIGTVAVWYFLVKLIGAAIAGARG
jgi:hypothetical protein